VGVNALLKRLAGRIAPSKLMVRGPARSAAVSLTFDDGPHPANTPVILDVLARTGTPATFFLQGSEISKAPELVSLIAAGGHVVANHGFRHLHWKREPLQAWIDDVDANQALIQRLAGTNQPRLYRPPYGEISARAAWRLCRRGYRIVLWSADPQDSFADRPEALLTELDRTGLRGGDIILLHDDGRHTIAALPALIERIRQLGLAIRPLDRLFSPAG
jgi:peptidoglycan/xylan/chitin deacetylase (PgdA/CDA1 family)